MYAEVLHDATGDIKACYCADTLPAEPGRPMLRFDGVPQGLAHARLNFDTITAMEIEGASAPKAQLDEAGMPVVVSMDRTKYIIENFLVDLDEEAVYYGIAVRGLKRKG